MSGHKTNKLKKTIKSWRVGDYIRQLSVVILGIIVTFAGSSAIARYTESREIVNALQLVKDELELNRLEVKRINDRITFEQKACRYILKYKGCMEKASEDTLSMFQNVPFQTRGITYTKDANELLKTSSLFQKVKPKALALQIIKAYNDIEVVSFTVKGFYGTKNNHIERLLNNTEFDFYSQDSEIQSVFDYWNMLLSSREGWNICNFVAYNFGSFNPFREVEVSLEETIKKLEEEYQLK